MVAIMGTSTCHVMNGTELVEVPGMCGVVDGGIVPGLLGLRGGAERGRRHLRLVYRARGAARLPRQGQPGSASRCTTCCPTEAAAQPAGAHGLIALDWESGNRSVLVDHHLSGLIAGMTLATQPPDIYRALIEATAFGTRVIIDTFGAAGVPVTELVIAGGLIRNKTIMQIYADVTRRPLSLIDSEQGPALGSAMHAAVAAGAYADIDAAGRAMGRRHEAVYVPDPRSADVYDELYAEYVLLHDYFGRGANEVMHRLRALRDRVLAQRPGQSRPRPPVLAEVPRDRRRARAMTVIGQLRDEVWALHAELVRSGLVAWTSGNVSARVPGADLMVIKPSGISYDDLTPESMVLCDLIGYGRRGEQLKPSSDTAAHAYVYRHMPHVGGVVHTHSAYATAWAARGEPVPCVLTAIADEFGGEIPIGPFALIGGDEIGQGIVATLTGHRSPAVLMRSHGVFTIGGDRQGRGQGGRHVRRRGPHRAPGAIARGARAAGPATRSTPFTDATKITTASADLAAARPTPRLPWLGIPFRRKNSERSQAPYWDPWDNAGSIRRHDSRDRAAPGGLCRRDRRPAVGRG